MSNTLIDSYLNKSTKLDGENYVNWKFKLDILMERVKCLVDCIWR
jgi:hypothetical protein